MSTQAEKKAEAQQKEVLEKGSYAALEEDDNSIDVSNDAYVGVDPEYRNAAEYDGVALQAPLDTPKKDDPEVAALEQRAKDSAEELGNLTVNRDGHTPNDARAGLGVKVADQQAAAAEAAEAAAAGDGEPAGEPDGSETPEGYGTPGGDAT